MIPLSSSLLSSETRANTTDDQSCSATEDLLTFTDPSDTSRLHRHIYRNAEHYLLRVQRHSSRPTGGATADTHRRHSDRQKDEQQEDHEELEVRCCVSFDINHTNGHRMIAARCFWSNRTLLRAGAWCFHRSLERKITNVFTNKTTETQKHSRRAQKYTTTTEQLPHITHKPGLVDVQEFDVSLLVSLLKQENASDICVIRVPPELKYTDHMIIVSGSSPRHLSAIAEFLLKVFKFLRKDEEPHVRLEGRDCDDWKCIDFGPMVLHLMLADSRQMYELEKLWTLRSYDEQLKRIPPETLPSDFIYDLKHTSTPDC
ncbi:hypothetical protein QQF64_009081 [Cirrhinus molitorella]|uniref:Mitochondrial assembly of ribosomal large subunit protein 1 n=1 Tax=Cirrhinus molitorella TaxID=172907 RepID=A0ABR3M383_9TELE